MIYFKTIGENNDFVLRNVFSELDSSLKASNFKDQGFIANPRREMREIVWEERKCVPKHVNACVKSRINSLVSPSGHSNVTSKHAHKIETLDQHCSDMKLIRPDTAADMALLSKPSGYRIACPNAQLRNSN